jgi:hypothetical protein
MLNISKCFLNKQMINITNKGYKMTQLHFYNNSHPASTTGIKVCIFGATSNMGPALAAHLVTKGSPCVMVHRNALDVISPLANDLTLIKSNPYRSWNQFIVDYNLIPDVIFFNIEILNNFIAIRKYENLVRIGNEIFPISP